MSKLMIQEIGSSSVVKPVTSGFLKRAGYQFAISGYAGCGFCGATYCYARGMLAGQEISSDDGIVAQWGRWVKPKIGAGEAIRNMRSSMTGKAAYMSAATDPYASQEKEYGITREILEAIADRHPGTILVIQTRGPLVTRDIDLLQELNHSGVAQVNITISTDNEERKKAFEPISPSLAQRWKAVDALVAAGIPTAVTVTPYLGVLDQTTFLERLTGSGLVKVVFQEFHAPASDSRLSASTFPEAHEVLRTLRLSERGLASEMQAFGQKVEKAGMNVGWGDVGFCPPESQPDRLIGAPLFSQTKAQPTQARQRVGTSLRLEAPDQPAKPTRHRSRF